MDNQTPPGLDEVSPLAQTAVIATLLAAVRAEHARLVEEAKADAPAAAPAPEPEYA